MNDWERWRARLSHRWRLRAPRTIRYDFRKQTCGPSSFASVELAFTPNDDFEFARTCTWPNAAAESEARDLDAAMGAGIHDALQPGGGSPYDAFGVRATCILVEWDEVGSSQVAFYLAAWHATRVLREQADWDLVSRA